MRALYGTITIGGWEFSVLKLGLAPRTIEFECTATLPGGAVIPSPSPARIRDLDGALVYAYTYDQGPIRVPPGPYKTVVLVQTVSFMPDGGMRHADMWRDRAPAGRLPGPGRALGPGGPRAIGR